MTQQIVDWTQARELLLGCTGRTPRCEQVALGQALGRVGGAVPAGAKGDFLAGRRLSGSALAAAAMAGVSTVTVTLPPRVAILSPGGEPLAAAALGAWVKECGALSGPPLRGTAVEVAGASQRLAEEVDLLLIVGGEAAPDLERPALFTDVDGDPGLGVKVYDGGESAPMVCLPGPVWELFVAFQVVVAPLVRRLAGLAAETPGGQAPLLFSKAWPEPTRRWYPGRLRVVGGSGRVEHLAAAPKSLVGLDCLFTTPPTEWIRDGDQVTWIGVGR